MRSVLKELFKFFYEIGNLVLQLLPDSKFGNRIRGKYIGLFCKGSKARLEISKSVHILYPMNLTLGDDVYIGYGSWINAQGKVVLQSEVMLGPYVCIASGNHTFMNGSYRFGEHHKDLVSIANGSWLGAGVKVMPGVNLGCRTVVGAGSVVTKSFDNDILLVGVPSTIKNRFDR